MVVFHEISLPNFQQHRAQNAEGKKIIFTLNFETVPRIDLEFNLTKWTILKTQKHAKEEIIRIDQSSRSHPPP